MKRVFITPNIQPTEETLDMSCFLSGVDKEEEEEIVPVKKEKPAVDTNPIKEIKITRDNYNEVAKTIGINSIISPKRVTANKIIKYVRSLKGQRKYLIENMYMICNEKVEAIEFIVDENTKNLNKKFKDITISDDIIYATIVRDDKIIIPTGDDCLKINDKVIVVSQNKKFEEIIFGGDK